jgi:hypothetical protein
MPGRVGAGVVWSWEGTLASPWWVKRLPLLEHPFIWPRRGGSRVERTGDACVALVGKVSPFAGASPYHANVT